MLRHDQLLGPVPSAKNDVRFHQPKSDDKPPVGTNVDPIAVGKYYHSYKTRRLGLQITPNYFIIIF